MAETADVIVVGAGIIGCAVARELARRGAQVRVFEAQSIGSGATHASAGVLAPYIEADEGGALLQLGVRSLAMYDRFVEEAALESGLPIEYRRCGTLEVAADMAAADRLRDRAAAQRDIAQWLDAAAIREMEASLAESIEGGLFIAAHGYVAAGALTEALAWGAVRHGAQIESGRHVASVRSDHLGARVVTDDGSEWSAGEVIVCAGSWTDALAGSAARARTVRPIRGQSVRVQWLGPPPAHVIWGADCYVVPWQDGLALIGATVEDVGFDARTTVAGIRDLLDAACELLPEAWRATFVEARAGLRPASGDGLPIIGRSQNQPHTTYATGHYRNGILLAPLTAQLVADLVIDGQVDDAWELLAP
jgi:glycine oxidase